VTEQGATFGARFLEEWQRLGGPLSVWSYAEIQELRASDREGMAAALRRHQPLTTYAALQRIRLVESPEALARVLFAQAQAAQQTNFRLMLALLT
jgi:hypothetical protein